MGNLTGYLGVILISNWSLQLSSLSYEWSSFWKFWQVRNLRLPFHANVKEAEVLVESSILNGEKCLRWYESSDWPRMLGWDRIPNVSSWRGRYQWLNTLRPRRNEQHFTDDIFKCIFFNENVWISIKISLKFVPNGPIKNIPALVQIMAWRRLGNKPLSEPMMVCLPTHICKGRSRIWS